MTGVAVKLRAVDHSSPYLYPSRTIEIRTSDGTFEGPVRAATFYEYHAKQKTPTAATLDSPALVNMKRLGSDQLRDLLSKNETYGKLLKAIETSSQNGQYASLKIAVLQPTRTPTEKEPAAMGLLREIRLREKFLRLIITLQQEAKLSVITIPFLELPLDEYKTLILQLSRALKDAGAEPMFLLDLNYAAFGDMLKLLVEEVASSIIGLLYRPYREYPINYDLVSQYHDRDVAFFMMNANRYDGGFDDIATMHYLPFFGNDVYAVRVPSSFHAKANDPPVSTDSPESEVTAQTVPRLQQIRFLNRTNLKVKPLMPQLPSDSILADIEYQDQDLVAKMLANRNDVNANIRNYLALHYFSKVHELKTSLLEFGRLREFIEEGSTKEYILDQPSLPPVLRGLEKASNRR